MRLKNPKRKGIDFENEIKKIYEEKGYYVWRQARSAFPDLIVCRGGVWYLIECKVNGRISEVEKLRLIAIADDVGAIPMLAFKKKGKPYVKVLE